MTLPSSGTITIGNIATEFGGTAPDSLSEYYRGGSRVPNITSTQNIPTSGQITLSNFYGASNGTILVLTAGTTTDIFGNIRYGFNTYEPGLAIGSLSPNTFNGATFVLMQAISPSGSGWNFGMRADQPVASNIFTQVQFIDNTSTTRTFTSASASTGTQLNTTTGIMERFWSWFGTGLQLFDDGVAYNIVIS